MKKVYFLVIVVIAITTMAFTDDPIGVVTVNHLSFTGITSNIADTTLYTPSADGDYDVIVYEAMQSPSFNNSGFLPTIKWTDEVQAEQNLLTLPSPTLGVGGASMYDCECQKFSFTLPVHVTSGNAIKFGGTYIAGSSSVPVDVFVTLVKH